MFQFCAFEAGGVIVTPAVLAVSERTKVSPGARKMLFVIVV
jgi:hypothetical protein